MEPDDIAEPMTRIASHPFSTGVAARARREHPGLALEQGGLLT